MFCLLPVKRIETLPSSFWLRYLAPSYLRCIFIQQLRVFVSGYSNVTGIYSDNLFIVLLNSGSLRTKSGTWLSIYLFHPMRLLLTSNQSQMRSFFSTHQHTSDLLIYNPTCHPKLESQCVLLVTSSKILSCELTSCPVLLQA